MDRYRVVTAGMVAAGGAVALWLSEMLGGWDGGIEALCVLMVLDLVVGMLRAGSERKWNSTTCLKGVVKKVGYLILVMVGVLFDQVTGMQAPLARSVVLLFLFAVESLSILEHLALLGVPIPAWLLERLHKVQADADAGGALGGRGPASQSGSGTERQGA